MIKFQHNKTYTRVYNMLATVECNYPGCVSYRCMRFAYIHVTYITGNTRTQCIPKLYKMKSVKSRNCINL